MIINLTQHVASIEQLSQGLRDVKDREALQQLLTITEEALKCSDEILSEVLESKASQIISEFVYPEIIIRCEDLLQAPPFASGLHAVRAVKETLEVKCLVGGAPILMEVLIRKLKMHGCTPLHALSARVSEDQVQPDGNIKKISIFKHLRFREAL